MADRQKSDLVSYVENQKSQQFTDQPFNTTDGLVLAELSYFDWGNMGIKYPSEETVTLRVALSKLDRGFLSPDQMELLLALEKCERFLDLEVSNFMTKSTPRKETQSIEDSQIIEDRV